MKSQPRQERQVAPGRVRSDGQIQTLEQALWHRGGPQAASSGHAAPAASGTAQNQLQLPNDPRSDFQLQESQESVRARVAQLQAATGMRPAPAPAPAAHTVQQQRSQYSPAGGCVVHQTTDVMCGPRGFGLIVDEAGVVQGYNEPLESSLCPRHVPIQSIVVGINGHPVSGREAIVECLSKVRQVGQSVRFDLNRSTVGQSLHAAGQTPVAPPGAPPGSLQLRPDQFETANVRQAAVVQQAAAAQQAVAAGVAQQMPSTAVVAAAAAAAAAAAQQASPQGTASVPQHEQQLHMHVRENTGHTGRQNVWHIAMQQQQQMLRQYKQLQHLHQVQQDQHQHKQNAMDMQQQLMQQVHLQGGPVNHAAPINPDRLQAQQQLQVQHQQQQQQQVQQQESGDEVAQRHRRQCQNCHGFGHYKKTCPVVKVGQDQERERLQQLHQQIQQQTQQQLQAQQVQLVQQEQPSPRHQSPQQPQQPPR